MKKTLIILALVGSASIFNSNAQDAPAATIHEYGIGLSSLNSFNLQYSWGNEKRLFRISSVVAGFSNTANQNTYNNQTDTNYNTSTNNNNTPINLTFGLNLAVVKGKAISEKFELLHGWVIGTTFSYLKGQSNNTSSSSNPNSNYNDNGSTSESKTYSYRPFVGIVLGARYKFTPSFILYAEIDPNLYYSYSKSTSSNTNNNQNYPYNSQSNYSKSYGISGLQNSGATLTFVYRLTK